MKRIVLICTLIFCLFCCFASVVTVSDNGFSYLFSFGSKSFSSPSVFSYNNDSLYLGEIRPSGLLKHVLGPTNSIFDVGSTKTFERVSSPAIRPSYVGIAKSFNWGDIATFYPFGLFLDVGKKKTYVALLVSSEESESNKYMNNWQDVYKGLCCRAVCGYCDSFSRGSFSFKSSEYLWLFLKQTGFSGNTGWNISFNYGEFGVDGYGRIGNCTSLDPVKTYGYCINLSGLSIRFNWDEYARAIYGGTAQKKAIKLEFQFKLSNFTFKTTNSATADNDTGKTTGSEYEISYDGSDFNSSFVVGINRPSEMPMTVNRLRFNINTSNATFGVNGAKFSMSLKAKESLSIFGSLMDINVSIDQDRHCSINVKLNI